MHPCVNKLRQIGLGVIDYESVHKHYPLSIEIGRSSFKGWIVDVLPHVGQQTFLNHTQSIIGDFKFGQQMPGWSEIEDQLEQTTLPGWHCPSDPTDRTGTLSYAGNAGIWVPEHGYNGIFREGGDSPEVLLITGKVRTADVTDGLSNTAMVSEWLHGPPTPFVGDEVGAKPDARRFVWYAPINMGQHGELKTLADACTGIPPHYAERYGWQPHSSMGFPWFYTTPGSSLYYHAMTPNRPSCTPWAGGGGTLGGIYNVASLHSGGVNVCFADGHVKLISDSVDLKVWQDFGSRSAVRQIKTFLDLNRE